MGFAKSPTTVDLKLLLDGPRSRVQLGATRYAIQLAEADGLIVQTPRPSKGAPGLHYKLTPKGRRRARR